MLISFINLYFPSLIRLRKEKEKIKEITPQTVYELMTRKFGRQQFR